jgi:hypothetical protein
LLPQAKTSDGRSATSSARENQSRNLRDIPSRLYFVVCS